MITKLASAFIAVSLISGCLTTQHYQADILGRWAYTDPKYEGGIQFLENGVCYRLNSDLTRGDVCQYELRRNTIYVPWGCISSGLGKGCSFREYHYLPVQDRLSVVVAQRGEYKHEQTLEKID